MVGDGACCTPIVAVGDGWNGVTFRDFTVGSTLGYGVAGRVIGFDNGFGIGTVGNINVNGKIGKSVWFAIHCKICDILLITLYVVSPYEKNGIVLGVSWIIPRMSLTACQRKSLVAGSVKWMLLECIALYQWYTQYLFWGFINACIYNGPVMDRYAILVYHDGPTVFNCQVCH